MARHGRDSWVEAGFLDGLGLGNNGAPGGFGWRVWTNLIIGSVVGSWDPDIGWIFGLGVGAGLRVIFETMELNGRGRTSWVGSHLGPLGCLRDGGSFLGAQTMWVCESLVRGGASPSLLGPKVGPNMESHGLGPQALLLQPSCSGTALVLWTACK